MNSGAAARLARALEDEALAALPPAARENLRTSAAVDVLPHGTLVASLGDGAGRRRVVEVDAGGTVLAVLRWREEAGTSALEEAWLRIPDTTWLVVRPRRGPDGPWGPSDVLAHAARPAGAPRPLTTFESIDYGAVDRIPTLAEPERLPPGGGVVVLNLLAALAADQGAERIHYRGPYPGEQLFLALLESFRYEAGDDEPLAAFTEGALAWRPAPHERRFAPDGGYVQLRGRVEKVVWGGRAYYRPDWQDIERHAPRRVRDSGGGGARCGLWALGEPIEDHLLVGPDGRLTPLSFAARPPAPPAPFGPAVVAALAVVATATSAPALGPFVEQEARERGFAWDTVPGDLIDAAGAPIRIAHALREVARRQLREAVELDARAATALAVLAEIARLAGDALRRGALRRFEALPEAEQQRLLESPPGAPEDAARVITDGVQALIEELG